jgi:hypothetical protein
MLQHAFDDTSIDVKYSCRSISVYIKPSSRKVSGCRTLRRGIPVLNPVKDHNATVGICSHMLDNALLTRSSLLSKKRMRCTLGIEASKVITSGTRQWSWMSTIHVNSKPAPRRRVASMYLIGGILECWNSIHRFNPKHCGTQSDRQSSPWDFYVFWERIGPMLVERTGGVLNLTPHFLISSGIIAIDQAAVPLPCLKWELF